MSSIVKPMILYKGLHMTSSSHDHGWPINWGYLQKMWKTSAYLVDLQGLIRGWHYVRPAPIVEGHL